MHRDDVKFGERVFWNERRSQGVLVSLVGEVAHIAVDNATKTDVRWFEVPLTMVEADGPSADDISDWRYEVTNGDTVLGLADWLIHRADAELLDADVMPEGLHFDGQNSIRDAQGHAWVIIRESGQEDPRVWREKIIGLVCEALGIGVPHV